MACLYGQPISAAIPNAEKLMYGFQIWARIWKKEQKANLMETGLPLLGDIKLVNRL
jgi:hypothetical protein